MASRFMKIKRVVIPFITLVIMTSQLAGCATMTSDEMLKSMNESPDVSIEYAIPDTGQQSLDATQVIDTEDQQIVRACLKSSNEDGNEGKRENLSRNKKFAFTIFPKSAELVEPAEKTLYHPAAWQNDKLV